MSILLSQKKGKNLEKKNFMAPFYGWSFKCLKAAEPLLGDSLLLTN